MPKRNEGVDLIREYSEAQRVFEVYLVPNADARPLRNEKGTGVVESSGNVPRRKKVRGAASNN